MKGWVIFFIAFALYFVSIFGGFIQDDGKVIQGDREMGRASTLISTWTRPYYYMDGGEFSVYRPITSFSFYLNALVTGKNAWGFRLGNVLIYGWICWLVYEVLKELKESRVAFWAAALFAVLPIHAEVVNNIVGRAEMLSLGLFLLAMLKVLDRKWEIGTMFLFLALLSKETAMVGVPILLFLILSNHKIEKKEKLGAGFFVMMAFFGFLLLRMVVLGGLGMGNVATMVENPLKFMTTEKRVMNAIALVPFGVSKIIFPVHLSYDYSYNQLKMVDSWSDWKVLLGLAMMGSSLLSFMKKDWRRNNVWMVGMMLFWGPILITGNIFFPIGTIFGERLWFWPSLGVVMLSFSAIRSLQKTVLPRNYLVPPIGGIPFGSYIHGPRGYFARLLHCFFIISCFIFAGRTMVRNFDWLSQERLFLHDAEYASQSVLAQSNAAAMYLIRKDLGKAKTIMEKANDIYPKYPELLNNWGMYYLWTGKKEEAKKMFEECLVERPGNGLCQGNLELVNKKER